MSVKQKRKKKKLSLEYCPQSPYFSWAFENEQGGLFRRNGHTIWLFEGFYLLKKKCFFKKYKLTMSNERFTSKI